MDPLLSHIFFIGALQNSSVATFNYISLALAFVMFVVGLYCISRKRKYGVYMLVSSLLLLVNPAISMIL